MSVIQSVFNTLKNVERCAVSVDGAAVHISSFSPKHAIYSSVAIECSGSGRSHVYLSQSVVAASGGCSRVEEAGGVLSFTQESRDMTIKQSVQPVEEDAEMERPARTYTSEISMKTGVFKKTVSLMRDSPGTLYLSNGSLHILSCGEESEDVIKIPAISISKEGTEKITVAASSLKCALPLIHFSDYVSISFNSEHLSLVLVFSKDVAHYSIVANAILD